MNLEDVPRRDRREILPFSLFLWMQRVFVRSSPISRMTGNGEIGLANYESNVFKVGKDASSTNNGRRVTKGRLPPPSRKLRSNRRGELAGVQSDFEFRVESVRVRVHRRSSHTSNPLSSVIRFNQPAPPRFDLYICVCIKYNTYICIHV